MHFLVTTLNNYDVTFNYEQIYPKAFFKRERRFLTPKEDFLSKKDIFRSGFLKDNDL